MWVLKREIPIEEGDTFYCGMSGLFIAGTTTIKFIKAGMYQDDLVLVNFKCAREGEFEAIYDIWRNENVC